MSHTCISKQYKAILEYVYTHKVLQPHPIPSPLQGYEVRKSQVTQMNAKASTIHCWQNWLTSHLEIPYLNLGLCIVQTNIERWTQGKYVVANHLWSGRTGS